MPRRIGSPAPAHGLQGEADEQGDQQGLQHLPSVKAETSVVGMMPSTKSTAARASPPPGLVPGGLERLGEVQPAPGWRMLPTTRPMASATVDITTK